MPAEVEALIIGPYENLFTLRLRQTYVDGIEEFLTSNIKTELLQTCGKYRRQAVYPFANPPEAIRSMIDGVHARDDGKQNLRGANVARRLFPSDVLLAGLEG